ncbi:hypothetical protein [Enterococcus wangshanyuanii]|uniref:Uncharacterized protein n=1 Tax=Enterococcus wangshanyuanii TaxID=2005703 RepID=A0ABQ1NSY5_9ENTE|nr:hypothetical protein [Enterococcus wangshanyuanii]GGC83827.1 hypothetical protein GCM10011573_11800 [Enterococcus wangshanyuanii]
MMENIIKISTNFHNTWLINVKKDSFAKENKILFGDTLRLSIAKGDSYYFAENIALTYEKDIISKETPTKEELKFFIYMEKNKEKIFSNSLAAKYDIQQYIRHTTTSSL